VKVRGRWSLLLQGQLLQFNLSFLIGGIVLCVVFALCSSSPDLVIRYGGCGASGVGLLALILFVIWYYGRQKARPSEGAAVVAIETATHGKITIENPPDSLFDGRDFRLVLRALVVGYDDDLCPDGELIGKATENEVRKWSEKEKQKFMQEHRQEIRGRRRKALLLLQQNEDADADDDL
jgi:hypothetical protein